MNGFPVGNDRVPVDGETVADPLAEWLEADGLGGFASGTICGIRTRRYHAVLLSAERPPTGRLVLVNGFDAALHRRGEVQAISSQRYTPDAVAPDGSSRLESFDLEPWPTWIYRLDDGRRLRQELFVARGRAITALRFTLSGATAEDHLEVRPLLSGRDFHQLHHENPDLRFGPSVEGERVSFSPYRGIPSIHFLTNGSFHGEPYWYRGFLYELERQRGLDCVEDLAAPGLFGFDLSRGAATMIISSDLSVTEGLSGGAAGWMRSLEYAERRRRSAYPSRLHRSAESYLVRRSGGTSIIAGYPWFTDWGRDTFISLRGLCLAGDRIEEAARIVLQWAGEVSEGMLPNFFPDGEREPDYNTADASLWYVVAAYEVMERARAGGHPLGREAESKIWTAIERILSGHTAGTRYGIGVDPDDGLLRAGAPGVQLTWMDAKVGDWVVTPRSGKPVEIQALWMNALAVGAEHSRRWDDALERARRSFDERFWNEARGCLFDVVDVDHRRGQNDEAIRPNQLLAVGGLPHQIVTGAHARSIVDCAERLLVTPYGVRSLAPGEPGYAPHYYGGPLERDGAYHRGTAWGWMLGPFTEAWVRVRGETREVKEEAYRRFVEPVESSMRNQGGIDHVAEITDAEEPYTPRGCSFQAWSLGELMRLKLDVLDTRQGRTAVIAKGAAAEKSTATRRGGSR